MNQGESKKPISEEDKIFMREAIEMSREGMKKGDGGPFGCVVVDENGSIIGRGHNKVLLTNDPTAHAEVVAIRDACSNIGHFHLDNCTIYASCEPCPMCLGAIYWARPARIIYACSREDSAAIDFDDAFLYKELTLPMTERRIPIMQMLRNEAIKVFQEWKNINNKRLLF